MIGSSPPAGARPARREQQAGQAAAKHEGGFTLIEMSMVIVIIALIIGGILAGREMIRAAEVRGTVSQMEKYSAAAFAFRSKYNCIPGDCANAVALGLGTAGGPGDNGDGNGRVYSDPWMLSGAAREKEMLNFWYHLSKAGLIDGSFNGYTNGQLYITTGKGNCPLARLGHNTYICALSLIPNSNYAGNAATWTLFGNAFYLSNIVDGGGYGQNVVSVPPDEAFAIDSKMDDGNPLTGLVQVGEMYSGPMITNPSTWDGPGYCLKAADHTQYDFSGSGCVLGVAKRF